jgi:phosphatidylserine decarboxylase
MFHTIFLSLISGEEMGYFAFGGSTILVLFQANRIVFDEDLQINSSKPIETLIQMGQSIGNIVKENKG